MQHHPTEYRDLLQAVKKNVSRLIVGKDHVVELLLVGLAAGSHVLLEDVPGIGKTSIISALARSFDMDFKRLQFTPDLMPSDITGFNMYNPQTTSFDFHPGAVMTHFLLADEINRTSPKTQSALLEIMQEKQVTVDGVTYSLPEPFMVMATQNPVEYMGTYPLPEAQLDRFIIRIKLGYPTLGEELEMLELHGRDLTYRDLEPIATKEDLLKLSRDAQEVLASEQIKGYIADITRATRHHDSITLGASPRATIMLLRATKALALLKGRDYCLVDDVQALVIPLLSHRIIISQEAKLDGLDSEQVIGAILRNLKAPKQ